MENIDFSLAPTGATHYYGKEWRKLEDSYWFDWKGCGWIRFIATCWKNYTPIPEHERALNWAADTYAEWPYDESAATMPLGAFSGTLITWLYWQERRAKRIAAGFIKESNTTGTVDKEDELTWLARNANPVQFQDPRTEATLIKTAGGWECAKWIVDGYDREQWMKRRIELGLEPEAPKPNPEWDGTGFPPVGWHGEFTWGGKYTWHECVVLPCNKVAYNKNTEWLIWFSSKADEAEFRPLRTSEQIAAEKKKEWVSNVIDRWKKADGGTKDFFDVLYDALLSGELEAPEGENETKNN